MTLVWFVVWLVANKIGDTEAVTFDPVNIWAGTLLLAAALDLGRQHTGTVAGKRRDRNRPTAGEPSKG